MSAPLRARFKAELGLTNTQLGLIFSGFAYPYAFLQIYGGLVSDRFGPRITLFVCGFIWAVATVLTGLAGGVISLSSRGCCSASARERPSRCDPSHAVLGSGGRTPLRAGHHPRLRPVGQRDHTPAVAWLTVMLTWRGSFISLGCVSFVWVVAWFWSYRDNPADHKGITQDDLAKLPPYAPKCGAVEVPWKRADTPDAAGQHHLFLLWLDVVAVPELAAVVFPAQL